MRLIEDKNERPAQNGTNGNGVHSDNGSASDSESEEEAEPVSATLVLRIIAERSSPDVSRKSSSVQDQHLVDQNGGSTGGTFLQVRKLFFLIQFFQFVFTIGPSSKINLQQFKATKSPKKQDTIIQCSRYRRAWQLSNWKTI